MTMDKCLFGLEILTTRKGRKNITKKNKINFKQLENVGRKQYFKKGMFCDGKSQSLKNFQSGSNKKNRFKKDYTGFGFAVLGSVWS